MVAGAGCCCWLLVACWLLLVDCCCWLLVACWLIAAADCCCWLLLSIAAVDCCYWLLVACWLLLGDCCCWLLVACWLIAAADCCCWLLLLIAAVDCCPKSLWIFLGYSGWFAAKTILQAKKSLNIFGLLVESLWIFPEYWWERSGREVRLGEVGSWLQQANEYYGCALGIYTLLCRNRVTGQ